MKFAQKLTCAMLLMLAAAFAVGGWWLVRGNFAQAMASAAGQNERWHLMQRYALESEVLGRMARGEEITDAHMRARCEALTGYDEQAGADAPTGIRLVREDGETVFSAFSPTARQAAADVFPLGEDAWVLRRTPEHVYMFLENNIFTPTGTYSLQTACDVSEVFAMRRAQLVRLWQLEFAALAACGGVAVAVSRRLTAPLTRLSAASARIAAGDYRARTRVESDDEIGTLSRSFDAMAEAVERNVDSLALSVRQREDFMSAFSHELKTPMTAIIGYADTLRAMQCDPDTQRRAAGYILSEAKRVEVLGEKLLLLMRLSDEALCLVPVSAAAAVRCAVQALEPVCGPVRLVWHADDEMVLADEDLLCSLLYNLAHNAVKASPPGARVCIEARGVPDGVRVTVHDDGCGIPPEELSRITEPFYMVDKSRARRQGGSGMGLALCSRIARAHGAALHFASRPGQGTTVTFVLRRAQTHSKEADV